MKSYSHSDFMWNSAWKSTDRVNIIVIVSDFSDFVGDT